MLDSRAMTKIESVILICVIVIAAAGGTIAYVLLNQENSSETIKIGLCTDLDSGGKLSYQEAILAVEHVNAEGGVLGRLFEVVAEDDDSTQVPADVIVATNAFNRLIDIDNADYIITSGMAFTSIYQEIASNENKILLDLGSIDEDLTQKVLDDYDNYKNYFRVGYPNETSSIKGAIDAILTIGEYTGLSKVALVIHDFGFGTDTFSTLEAGLEKAGMEVVNTAKIPLDAVDFSSYFARAEAAGAEMMVPVVLMGPGGISFVKEYHDRQSPMVLLGMIGGATQSNFWEITDGKCEYFSCAAYPPQVWYPITNKTLAFSEAYMERWGEVSSGATYDAIRYILTDAIKRAGTFETNAVISALETVNIETSLARQFVFTSSHDIMVGELGANNPDEDYYLICHFQWQDGELKPVYPKKIMDDAGTSYKVPDWPGPWD